METMHFTRAMQKKQDDFIEKIDRMVTAKNVERKLNELSTAEKSRRPSVIAEICRMFRYCGIECSEAESYEYYSELLEKYDDQFTSFDEIAKSIIRIMYKNFTEYPSPADYMLRIVNRLSNPDDHWENDTLRLRILKQFIKYGNCLKYVSPEFGKVSVYNGKNEIERKIKEKTGKKDVTINDILENIDDSIFDDLKTATKDQKQAAGKYGLIRLADNLACGRFRSECSNRQDLYMFAIVFNMTYSADDPDPDSDIDKNLFKDYYTSNLIRFITDEYSENSAAFETEPSGYGINYKNYAEMIYLYYISKNMDPLDKLQKSYDMIKRVTNKEKYNSPAFGSTTVYINSFTSKLLKMNEEEFETAITRQYDCSTAPDQDNGSEKNPFQVQEFHNKAFRKYKEYRTKLNELSAIYPDKPDYGVYFIKIDDENNTEENKTELQIVYDILSEFDPDNTEKKNKFYMLLNRIDSLLKANTQFLSSNDKDTKSELKEPANITRTDIIKAFELCG